MEKELKSYTQATQELGWAVNAHSTDSKQSIEIKKIVQGSYNSWGHMTYNKAFLNWGLLDKKIHQEYQQQNFCFANLCPHQDINAQLLLYFLIRPLIQKQFFNKQLLEIGCGNGIGLKMASQLLHAEYALGIDLVHQLVHNSHSNFYATERINYLQNDAELLALKSESFDIIMNLESSHLYPQPELFFSEVARVLAPGGFFCYADIYTDSRKQPQRLDRFIASRNDLQILKKTNITKMVQASIYNRLITNEQNFYKLAMSLFDISTPTFKEDLFCLIQSMGLSFLPWWKVWLKIPMLRPIAKATRNSKYWGGNTKLFFYYLVQKR